MTSLTERTYNYTIWMQNTTGNWNQSARMFVTIDWTQPFIGFVSPTPANNTYTNNNWTYINTTVADTLSPNTTAFIDFNRSLVGWWKFNEGTGTNAQDFSTYGNNGTLKNMNHGIDNCTGNCSGWTTSGKFGSALQFDGVDDYVDFGTDSSLSMTRAITMETWVFPTINVTFRPRIIRFGVSESNNQGSHLAFGGGTGNDSFEFYVGNGSVRKYARSLQTLNSWSHIIGTFDGNNVKLYVNGVNTDSDSFGYQTNISYNNSNHYVGIYSNTGTKSPFNGTIDEVRIYNRALSEEEINASYNAGVYRLYHNFTNTPDGVYNYTAYAEDLAGNVNQTETRTVIVPYFVSSCQDLDVAGRYYMLTQNVSSSGTCFTVKANNIILDGNGYWINYSQSTTGYAINNTLGYNFTTIKNLNIVQENASVSTAYAIYFTGASNGTIQNNTITTNGTEGYGVVFFLSSNYNTLSNNGITTSGQYGYGAYLESSNYNTLSNNTITTSGTSGYGAYLFSSSNYNTISNNTITTSGSFSYGAYLYSSSSNTLSNNRISTALAESLYIYGTTASQFNQTIGESNLAHGKPIKYYFNLTDATIADNSTWGQLYVAWSSNVTISNITIADADNIVLGNTTNSRIISSNISNATAHGGIKLYPNSKSNNLTGNTITTSGTTGYGAYLESSNYNTLSNNTITTSGSDGYGARLSSSSNYNTLSNNTITTFGVEGYGAFLDTSSNNTISNNNVTASGQWSSGMYLQA